MRISDWSSDVCSSDLLGFRRSVFRMALLARLKRQHQSNVHRDREAKGDTLASVHVTTPSPPPLPPSPRVSVHRATDAVARAHHFALDASHTRSRAPRDLEPATPSGRARVCPYVENPVAAA